MFSLRSLRLCGERFCRFKANRRHYLRAASMGGGAALACFLLGLALFGYSENNWFVSVGRGYQQGMDISQFPAWKFHLIFTIPACLFSPIGEELFFRGLLQRTLEDHFSRNVSASIGASWFSLIHLCHHGISVTAGSFAFLWLSASLWVVLMFATSVLFAYIRHSSHSIYPTIVCHMVFNLAMNTVVFEFLLANSI